MEELKNENVEESVVEQRPSTKYGRTAYQQQMQEEQAAQGEATQQSAERPYQQYQQAQQQDWQQQNPCANQQYNAYTPYEETKPEVKNLYAYILMVLVGIVGVISVVLNIMSAEAYSMGDTIEEIVNATLVIAEQPAFMMLSTISDLLFWATVAFLVIDIMQLHKAGKKLTGAILFAIFLRPAYFIWRAHLLGQKKVGAILYTVAYYVVGCAGMYVLLSASMEMVMRTMY